MPYRAPIYGVFVALCICATAGPLFAQSLPQLGPDAVVNRMLAAESVAHNNPQYVALRQYRLAAADSKVPSSTVLAKVEYLPPSKKQFTIQESQGSDRGEKVVRKVLEHEVQMATHGEASEFSTGNYTFTLLPSDTLAGKRFYVVQLTPKRECTELIRGKAWVDPSTFLITRIEGEPAKSPSWWVKSLHITIDFGRTEGMWLPLETRATADLRLLGKQTLTAENLRVQAVAENASLRPARIAPRRSKTPRPLTAAGAWVAQ
jgi:hypothetical protein